MAADIEPRHIKAARALVGLTVRDLAERAGIAPNTVVAIEAGRGHRDESWWAVRQALERAGIVWVDHGVALPPRPKRSRNKIT